jgi:hypothetical protein
VAVTPHPPKAEKKDKETTEEVGAVEDLQKIIKFYHSKKDRAC